MSYDNTAEIVTLAKKHNFEFQPIAMKNTHHAKMTELLIGKDLSWLKKAAYAHESVFQNDQATSAFRQ
jgi:hypothetical protein